MVQYNGVVRFSSCSSTPFLREGQLGLPPRGPSATAGAQTNIAQAPLLGPNARPIKCGLNVLASPGPPQFRTTLNTNMYTTQSSLLRSPRVGFDFRPMAGARTATEQHPLGRGGHHVPTMHRIDERPTGMQRSASLTRVMMPGSFGAPGASSTRGGFVAPLSARGPNPAGGYQSAYHPAREQHAVVVHAAPVEMVMPSPNRSGQTRVEMVMPSPNRSGQTRVAKVVRLLVPKGLLRITVYLSM